MKYDKLFLIVGGALLLGFVVGFAAGLDNPPAAFAVQWETLLAGAAAILGGWLAYIGAKKPHEEAKSNAAVVHAHEVRACFLSFLLMSDPETKVGQHFREVMFKASKADREKFIWGIIEDGVKKFPKCPANIADFELMQMYIKIPGHLSWWEPDDTRQKPVALDVDETREIILEYIRAVESRI